MTATEHGRFMKTYDDFRCLLSLAQDERDKRGEIVDGEVGWVAYERQMMLDGVNEFRRAAGQPDVSMEQLRGAENQAVGHVDYSRKFALYCAELAHQTGAPR